MLTKPQFFYDNTTKQAIGFQNPFYLKKAQQLEPQLYIGDIIEKTNSIVIPDSEETLTLVEESHSKMLLKHKDNMMNFDPTNSSEPTLSTRPTNVELLKELPKVSMVNMSLKKLKHHLANFDVDLFSTFNQHLVDELSEVQNVFYQMEQVVEQHRLESKTCEVRMNQVLNENERLLEQVMSKDIVNLIANYFVENDSVHVHECQKCFKLETKLQTDFVEKEICDKLYKIFTILEKHCISLEVDTQLKQEIFQRDNSVSNQSAPRFDQLFELNELKAQSQEKDTVFMKLKEIIKYLSGNMDKDKIKQDFEEIETINIELDHRVTKLIAENEHLKQTYKQLYDLIKPAHIRSKEQCAELINQVNLKSVEISDLNASLQEKALAITTLKDELRKLKGKSLIDNDVSNHPSDPEMHQVNVEPITPKLLNKRSAHSTYIKHTQELAAVLKDLVDHIIENYPLDPVLESACKYTKLIQELLPKISSTCPSINNSREQLVDVTPMNKVKRVRFTEPITSSRNTITKIAHKSDLASNKPMLSSTGIKQSTSASGSQPSGNTKKDKILQTQSRTLKNKVEAHHRKVKSSLKNKDHDVAPKGTAHVKHSKLNANSEFKCVKITTTAEVPLRKPIALESETSKPAVTLVYLRKPRKSKTNVPVSKSKVVQIVLWYLDSGCSKHMTEDRSQLTNFVNKFLGTIKFGNDHVAKILGYGDYQIGNVTISRVYYVCGFLAGQILDSELCWPVQEQTDGEAMINSIKHGEHPLPVVAQVSLARTAPNAPSTLKDPKFWTVEEKKTRKVDRLAISLLIQGLPNDIYSFIDSNDTAKDLWDALERQMRVTPRQGGIARHDQ
ncbi:hypothetical protein Tco_0319616 [Tanacetum coccineum]